METGGKNRDQRHGVVTELSASDRAAVARLLELCNQHEGLELPIVLAPIAARGAATTEFLFVHHGAPVGFAWLPDDPEPEACLMVHPAHRCRGIGRALVTAVRAECRRRGLPGCLLVCDEAAPASRAFAVAVGGRYQSSEYRLALDRGAIDRSRPRQLVALRPAGVDDTATLARILSASFGSPAAAAREQVERGLDEAKRRYYLATVGGDPVGMLLAGEWEGTGGAGITAFGVLPDYRGRGIGRQMLVDAVDALLADGWDRILIEVVTDNVRALTLYQSCGFRVVTAYAFYDLDA